MRIRAEPGSPISETSSETPPLSLDSCCEGPIAPAGRKIRLHRVEEGTARRFVVGARSPISSSGDQADDERDEVRTVTMWQLAGS